MKRTAIVSTAVVAILLLTGAFIFVQAETRSGHGWCGGHWHRPGPMGYLAHELKLSDGQRTQIKTLLQAERPAFSAHVQELLEENKEMNAIASSNNPDQNEVQSIADRQAKTIASLLVEKEQLQSKIYTTVLNPEQRSKADALRKKWESHLDHAAARLATQPAAK